MDNWTDRESGFAAVWIVTVMALFIAVILAGILAYATSWGYTVRLF